MSRAETVDGRTAPYEDWIALVEDRRESLERIAAKDLPISERVQHLLEQYDEEVGDVNS